MELSKKEIRIVYRLPQKYTFTVYVLLLLTPQDKQDRPSFVRVMYTRARARDGNDVTHNPSETAQWTDTSEKTLRTIGSE